jgi:hypothetical protein
VAGSNFSQTALLDEAAEDFGERGAARATRPHLADQVLEGGAAVRLAADVLQQIVGFHCFHYIVAGDWGLGPAQPLYGMR